MPVLLSARSFTARVPPIEPRLRIGRALARAVLWRYGAALHASAAGALPGDERGTQVGGLGIGFDVFLGPVAGRFIGVS
jgi:hypothetical protein